MRKIQHPHPDYWLVQQYLQGDRAVWDCLCQRAYPIAERYLRYQNTARYLHAGDAADILSEAFLRCQLRADRFQGYSSFPDGSAALCATSPWIP